MRTIVAYFASVFLLAVFLDLLVIFWLRRRKKRSEPLMSQENNSFSLLAFISTLISRHSASWPHEELRHKEQPKQRHSTRNLILEWGIIFLTVTLFATGILDLSSFTRLPGNESEIFQSLDRVFYYSLLDSGKFPLWNPFLRTGQPYVADPMTHVFNPLVSLPVLLFGVRAGFKLSIYLSFVIAAFGMWRLMKEIGISSPIRIWGALIFTFAGQPVARFFQGEYLFVLGFAWIPWILSSLILVRREKSIINITLAALFSSLLFFCGNVYYQFYMLIFGVILAFLLSLNYKKRFPYINLNISAMLRYLLVALLVFGCIAIQLLPLLEMAPRLSKDIQVTGSHTLGQVFLDFTSKDISRPDAFNTLPAREEFYAYLGYIPIVALLLLPLAWKRYSKRLLIFFICMLIFVILWVGLDGMPWKDLFVNSPFLAQFRHLLRILLFGSLAIIILAGFSFDLAWVFLYSLQRQPSIGKIALLKKGLAFLGFSFLIAILFFSVWDVFSTHRNYIHTQEVFEPGYKLTTWLRNADDSDYYVRINPTNAWHAAVFDNRLRYMDSWYSFADPRDIQGGLVFPGLEAKPNYVIQPEHEDPPISQSTTVFYEVEGFVIYQMKESLPIAFTVPDDRLKSLTFEEPLLASEVQKLSPFFDGPNRVEIIVDGQPNEKLVLLVTHFPGWRLNVDGKYAPLEKINGYMGADVIPGVHKYVFVYQPFWFYVGMALSLLTTAVIFSFWGHELWRRRTELWEFCVSLYGRIKVIRLALSNLLPKEILSTNAKVSKGALIPQEQLGLQDGKAYSLTLQPAVESPLRSRWDLWVWATWDFLHSLIQAIPLHIWLFALSLIVYLSVRLIGLTDFPIYFFCDEANHVNLVADLVRDNFQNADGEFLPTYFYNVFQYNLGVSVYLQLIPYLLFGKSVFTTRAVTVFLSILAAFSSGAIIHKIFKLKYAWIAILVLSLIPAWFIHSRTAFETATMVIFYATGFYFYLSYRYNQPKHLYWALVFFGLAFYSYSPGQLVVGLTGVLLFISDFRYHLKNKDIILRGLGLITLLALPYLRFRINHPDALGDHLYRLNSYWIQPIPLWEKLARYFKEYIYGLNPYYWFFPNGRDLIRHVWKGSGHIQTALLPFMLIGLVVAIKNIKQSAFRAILISFIVAPSGAAIAQIAVTRALVMVFPAAILIALGLIKVLEWVERHWVKPSVVAWSVFVGLSLVNVGMLRIALNSAATWYDDYGLGGMQYGAQQMFSEVDDLLHQQPDKEVIVSPSWANSTDVLARFFLGDPLPVRLGSIDEYLYQHLEISKQTVFVMTPDEYAKALSSEKFENIRVLRTVSYPNGEPGFYFVSLNYVAEIDKILEKESMERRELQEAEVVIKGQRALVKYSLLDMGEVASMFDGDERSLARSFEANPFIIEINFPQPISVSGISMVVGDANISILAWIFTTDREEPHEFEGEFDTSVQDPRVQIEFGDVFQTRKVYLQVTDLNQHEPGHVHIWEIIFSP